MKPLLLWCLCLGSLSATEWQWPVNTHHGVTGTFGEYRGQRFHMGFDFSTGGVEGAEIRPAKAGRVVQVRATRRGYGLVIYVRHPDKKTTVYAHLAAFGPKVAAAIRKKGKDPTKRFGTLQLNQPVQTGDIIAWSGESGAGLPHLHFEVRDEDNRPLNPTYLDFPALTFDTEAALGRVRLVPLNDAARVNGDVGPFVAEPGRKTIQARGQVGIHVEAFLKGPRGSKLAPSAIRITFEGKTLAHWQPKFIDFNHQRDAGLVLDPYHSGFGPTTFFYCFDGRTESVGTMPFLEIEGIADIQAPATLAIEIQDLEGQNRTFTKRLDPEAAVLPAPREPQPVLPTTLGASLIRDRLGLVSHETEGTLFLPQKMEGLEKGVPFWTEFKAGKPAHDVVWRTNAGRLKRVVGCLPDQSDWEYKIGPFHLKGIKLVGLPPTAVILEPADPKVMTGVLEYKSPVLRFGRHGWPTKGLFVEASGSVSNQAPDLGLYGWSAVKKKWRHWNEWKPESPRRAKVPYLTPLVLARDISPPVILKPKVHKYFVGKRIVIPVRDEGSGIDNERIRVTDTSGEVESDYDPDRRWIVLNDPDSSGPWTVRVVDQAGQSTEIKNLRLK
ncbi:M23 family metallopeptidase [Sulfidibacter corallicola]|uniref:M23 family metallopeptidase n=1 Tax=Sulfidibacter corallicola TaxID=2818388 RepID=A0A8A4TUW5_SULCO|nr:M23 family metallopeptidase [Sulfidibacter corallicola]QTD53756.1 M23 family metallopeptidase [Sulfidibacter corallicola]